MRMWSRGLGRQNLGIDFKDIRVMTLAEALDFMADEAREPLLKELESKKVITLSGKMLPPTGWEFVITMGFKDLFTVARKFIHWKIIKVFF
ncbi:MAG: hypothetical protein SV775_02810 [Thermodesulfobacteriota bacterium]|nr:hypothetical protein [Thermodesulfobacteriota bacterium]